MGDRDLVQAVLNDLTTAPISEKDRALYAFVKKVNADSVATTPEDIDQLRKVGWTDEAIYDAITVCALFNFYNVWIDATGVSDMPALGYADAGAPPRERGLRAGGR